MIGLLCVCNVASARDGGLSTSTDLRFDNSRTPQGGRL